MKVLLIGDPHFKADNAYESEKFIEATYKHLEKNIYDQIIILGDILDSHEKISLRPLCRSINFIKSLSKKTVVYVLIGNHDRLNNAVFMSEEHPFTALKGHKNITIVDKVMKKDDFIYVPYVPAGMFQKALSTIDFDIKNIKIIFAHQEFENSIFKNQGDKPPSGPAIYSGHIHNYIKIKNVTYVGTPFQHSFYDDPNKFIMKLTIEEDIIKEEKISLDIIKKRIQEISISELEDYQIKENYLTKLVIKGDRKLLNTKKIQNILKHPNITYKLDYQRKEKIDTSLEKKEDINFENFLNQRLKHEKKELKFLYQKLKQKLKS